MSKADYEAAVAAFLSTKGVTRCPTVCAVPTQATVADADRAAYRDYIAAQETARLEKLRADQRFTRFTNRWARSRITGESRARSNPLRA